jgi:hypothetical protein
MYAVEPADYVKIAKENEAIPKSGDLKTSKSVNSQLSDLEGKELIERLKAAVLEIIGE